MIVVDASAAVEMLLGTKLGLRVEEVALATDALHAPHLLDAEVLQVLRRFVARKQLAAARAAEAVEDLAAFPLRRHAHLGLLGRVFDLRHNLTAYDAIYVALAEALDATLLTCDKALAQAAGITAAVEVVVES
ncbi:MAG: type II toxin-antitoxin system VapC family toxin [Planctomycetota bacterium]